VRAGAQPPQEDGQKVVLVGQHLELRAQQEVVW
jgi:hypothetical protein